MEEIKNRVAESGIVTIDLLDYKPGKIEVIDIKDQLWQGMVIKEKDFRDWIKSHNWSDYSGKSVCLYCSVDAIIPDWVYMLVVSSLLPFTKKVCCVEPEAAGMEFWKQNLKEIDPQIIIDNRIVVKGCGDDHVPFQVFTEFLVLFQDEAKSIMYGEPCSTVPVYKRK